MKRRLGLTQLRLTSLRTRLFLAIFATCILLVIIMHFGVRSSFQSGFIGYIKTDNQQRTKLIADALAEQYQEVGSWQFLMKDERAFFRILRSIEQGQHASNAPQNSRQHGPMNGHRHMSGMAPRNAPPQPMPMQFWVLDKRNKPLYGRKTPIPPDAIREPIKLNNGKIIGWVAASSTNRLTREIDLRFDAQQLYTSWIVAGISLLVALIATYFLARGFLQPIKRLLQGTQKLAAGDFSTRVPDSGPDELAKLAQNFNHLASTLEKNEQMRRDYMADISHELRTPLSVLRGELEAVQDGIRQATPETLNSLLAETETLIKLVNDLHLLSLSDRGSLAYRKQLINLTPVITVALSHAQRRLAEKPLTLEIALPEQVNAMADPDRITQLFYNLLENSLRYTHNGGQLRLQGEINHQQFILRWEDSAPGLSVEQCDKIFERFYRAESSRNRASGGSGLGLAICFNIVEAHNGTISASPSELGGVCITLTLPLMTIENTMLDHS